MPPAIRDLRIYQLGRETTKGTAVAATTRWVGTLEIEPDEPVITPQVQTGLMVEGAPADAIARRSARLRFEADLTYEQILHVFNMTLKGVTTGTGAGADKTWIFDPTFTGDPGLNSFTVQRRLTDGTTNWDERVAYVLGDELTISGAVGENAKVELSCFGRPVETGQAITGAISVPTVNFVPAQLFKLSIDDTLAGMGTTLFGQLVSFRLRFVAPSQPRFYLDGRSDRSFAVHSLRRASWELEAQVEWDAAAEAERAKAQSRANRYVRLVATGPALGASAYKIQIDFVARHQAGQYDQAGDRDGADTTTLRLVSAHASDLTFKAIVVNALSTLP